MPETWQSLKLPYEKVKTFCRSLYLQIKNHPEITSKILARLKSYLSEHQDTEHYKGKLFIVDMY